jgi:hypothetical protein
MFIARRKFLAMLGGAAAWPLATRVQLGISMALLMLAASPVALNQSGEALAQCWCQGCGCKGGPGYRDSTGRRVAQEVVPNLRKPTDYLVYLRGSEAGLSERTRSARG